MKQETKYSDFLNKHLINVENAPEKPDTPFTGSEKWIINDSGHTITAEYKEGYELICTVENPVYAPLLKEAKNMYDALNEYVKVINRTDAAKHYYGKLTDEIESILSRINNK